MAYFRQQPPSSSSNSSPHYNDSDTSNVFVNKRIKMEDSSPSSNKITDRAINASTGDSLFTADLVDDAGQSSHVAVHLSKSDNARSQNSAVEVSKVTSAAQSTDINSPSSRASPRLMQPLDARVKHNIVKKKLSSKTSEATSRESPKLNEFGIFHSDAIDGFVLINPKSVDDSINQVKARLWNEASSHAKYSHDNKFSQASTAFINSSAPNSNRSQQPLNLSMSHHSNSNTITASSGMSNMDINVDMDLPSPPNEESQHSDSRSPSGAGMDDTFGEAPHPTPGPIQDTDMECVDGDDGFPSASFSQKSLLSSALAARDSTGNRSRISSPFTTTGSTQDGSNPKVLSHDSQWMLQYLQPFSSDSSSSTCTDGNEYYMPDNVRSQLMMIARMSDEDRLILLDHFIWSSPMRQLHHVKVLLDPYFTRDFVGALPRDVSLHVLSYLEPADLGRCARVSRLWRVICEDNLLWQVKCQEAGHVTDAFTGMRVPMRTITSATSAAVSSATVGRNRPSSVSESHAGGMPDELGHACRTAYGSKASSRASNCGDAHNSQIAASAQQLQQQQLHHGPPQPFTSSWKQTYRYHAQTERNWRTGQHIFPLELYNHGRNFITSMVIAGDRVLTGSEDTTVRVVELGSVSEIADGKQTPREVRCHSNGVWALAADDGLCVSGGTDRTISVVDLITGQQITQLRGHTSTVRCLALKNDICVSGSRDNSLRVWAARTGTCLFTLNGHGASVRCVCFDGTTIVSGSYDASVRVWNADDGRQRHELVGHTGRIYCLEFDGERIVSGCLNSLIIVWNAATGERVFELHGHNSLISALKLSGDTLISGGADSVVRVWNLNDRGQDLQMYVGQGKHSSAITAIHIGRTYFVTSSDDGYVKLWDLRTGIFVRNLMKFDEAADMGVVWRIVATDNKLICACGHRARMTDSKVLLLDFDARKQIEDDLLLKPSTTSATPPPASGNAGSSSGGPKSQQQQHQQAISIGNNDAVSSPNIATIPSASVFLAAGGISGGIGNFFGTSSAATGAASAQQRSALWANYNLNGHRNVVVPSSGVMHNFPTGPHRYSGAYPGYKYTSGPNASSLLPSFAAALADGVGENSSSAISAVVGGSGMTTARGTSFNALGGLQASNPTRARCNAGGGDATIRLNWPQNASLAATAITNAAASRPVITSKAGDDDDAPMLCVGAGDGGGKSQSDAESVPKTNSVAAPSLSLASASTEPLAPQPESSVASSLPSNQAGDGIFPRKPSSSLAPGAERST